MFANTRRLQLALVLLTCALAACQPGGEGESAPSPETTASKATATAFMGMYRYMADAAVFRDCASGRSYPVLIEAGHLPLERAYLAQRGEPGAEVLALFDAEVVMRAPEPGLPARAHLRVLRFDRLRPGDDCRGSG